MMESDKENKVIERPLIISFNKDTGEFIWTTLFKFEWGDKCEGEFDHVFDMNNAYKVANFIINCYENYLKLKLPDNPTINLIENNPLKNLGKE